MADAGDLGRLPPELRKEIYSYVLVEPEKVGILRLEVKGLGKVARFNHHRNNKHRGKFYDHDAKAWLDAPPSFTSVLYVNKSVALEATEVLYGFNEFEFLHAGALLCFLRHIGPSIQYLRSISLVGQGVLYNLHWDALDISMELLAQVASLRSLEISHLALCGEHDSPSANRRPVVTPKTFVQHCKPLLGSLKAKAESHNWSLSIVDLIQITLPDCAFDKYLNWLSNLYNRDTQNTQSISPVCYGQLHLRLFFNYLSNLERIQTGISSLHRYDTFCTKISLVHDGDKLTRAQTAATRCRESGWETDASFIEQGYAEWAIGRPQADRVAVSESA